MTEQANDQLRSFGCAAQIKFNLRTGNLYGPAIRATNDLVRLYSDEGIASCGKYLRITADAVEEAFQSIEDAFKEIYIDPFEGTAIPKDTVLWLRQMVKEIIDHEVVRAQDIMQQLCSSFASATPDRYRAHVTNLQSLGGTLQQRLNDFVTLLTLEAMVPSTAPNQVTVAAPKGTPPVRSGRDIEHWDVFISHATDDKPYVEPLVKALTDAGVSVWYDKEVLEWGDRLRPKINEGLIKSDYAIAVLSKAYLAKRKWTEHELDSLFAREELGQIIILPIWHGVVRKDLLEYDPSLADRLAKISETDSYNEIVRSALRKLGRSKEASSDYSVSAEQVAWPSGKKSEALVHAGYDKPGTGERAQLYVRRSPITKAWFVLEGAPDREHHGTRDDIAGRLALCDRHLRNDGFKRMNFGNASGDSAFDL
jgi:hypothetical protein